MTKRKHPWFIVSELKCNKTIIKIIIFAVIFIALISCNTSNNNNSNSSGEKSYSSIEEDESGFLTITVDVNKNEPLLLSYIADEVKKIELETESKPSSRKKVLFSGDYIFLLTVDEASSVLLFDNNGKFLNQIGSSGIGLGQYGKIYDIAADFKNEKIYVSTEGSKLICYDFVGNVINEAYNKNLAFMHFLNNKLFSSSEHIEKGDVSEFKAKNMIYEINDNLKIIDSIKIRDVDLKNKSYIRLDDGNYMTCVDGETYIFYPVNIPDHMLPKPFITDTLYLLKGKTLIPHLKIHSETTEKKRMIEFIFRNTRFIFAKYIYIGGEDAYSFFCYDMKEKKGYHMKKGFRDDIHTGEIVRIHPVDSDANKFYYLHSNQSDLSKNESNLTLYIGTFKK